MFSKSGLLDLSPDNTTLPVFLTRPGYSDTRLNMSGASNKKIIGNICNDSLQHRKLDVTKENCLQLFLVRAIT